MVTKIIEAALYNYLAIRWVSKCRCVESKVRSHAIVLNHRRVGLSTLS